jgi:hypothetical protein
MQIVSVWGWSRTHNQRYPLHSLTNCATAAYVATSPQIGGRSFISSSFASFPHPLPVSHASSASLARHLHVSCSSIASFVHATDANDDWVMQLTHHWHISDSFDTFNASNAFNASNSTSNPSPYLLECGSDSHQVGRTLAELFDSVTPHTSSQGANMLRTHSTLSSPQAPGFSDHCWINIFLLSFQISVIKVFVLFWRNYPNFMHSKSAPQNSANQHPKIQPRKPHNK